MRAEREQPAKKGCVHHPLRRRSADPGPGGPGCTGRRWRRS
jgi:hypothetical protein